MVLGLMLWFIWANNAPVSVAFPFRLGTLQSTTGLVILLSALVGSLATALTMTIWYAWVKVRTTGPSPGKPEPAPEDHDLPPPDYAAKASELPPEHHWS
jgi:hypothetical protein